MRTMLDYVMQFLYTSEQEYLIFMSFKYILMRFILNHHFITLNHFISLNSNIEIGNIESSFMRVTYDVLWCDVILIPSNPIYFLITVITKKKHIFLIICIIMINLNKNLLVLQKVKNSKDC